MLTGDEVQPELSDDRPVSEKHRSLHKQYDTGYFCSHRSLHKQYDTGCLCSRRYVCLPVASLVFSRNQRYKRN